VKPRQFFYALVLAFVFMLGRLAGVPTGSPHRLSGHPSSLAGKLVLAKRQVAHDRTPGSHHWVGRDRVYVNQLQRALRPVTVTAIICAVFGPYCSQALRVAWCESRYRVYARNGQYLGIFQLGSHERATYGGGSDAWSQAVAAFRYFVASGRDWSPWECRP
jgi:hypothetical protein